MLTGVPLEGNFPGFDPDHYGRVVREEGIAKARDFTSHPSSHWPGVRVPMESECQSRPFGTLSRGTTGRIGARSCAWWHGRLVRVPSQLNWHGDSTGPPHADQKATINSVRR